MKGGRWREGDGGREMQGGRWRWGDGGREGAKEKPEFLDGVVDI